jgi:alpha,alpha-trehalase
MKWEVVANHIAFRGLRDAVVPASTYCRSLPTPGAEKVLAEARLSIVWIDAIMRANHSRLLVITFLLSIALAGSAAQAAAATAHAEQDSYADVLKYIDQAWDVLTRSMDGCDTVTDLKMPEQSVLYLPAEYAGTDRLNQLEARCKVRVVHLPKKITRPGEMDSAAFKPHGLLYLENSYVVPGGFFNEMYGWDSYFILRGLVRAGRLELPRGMVENFFFEIEHYGAVLNANRTYYLTRSQPPFLSSMVLAVYQAQRERGADDRKWLARAYDFIERDHAMWTHAPHLAGDTGLSRYFDMGEGPVPEENETRNSYYREVIGRLIEKPELRSGALVTLGAKEAAPAGPAFAVQVCEDKTENPGCEQVARFAFTPDFYKGDRSMRESGFDISFRWGPYGGRTHHYAPVCLNSLLYKTEKDLEQIASILGRSEDATRWRSAALKRQQAMQTLMWDQQRGMFFDYDVQARKRSTYEFGTTFYPLWVGLASKMQAAAVLRGLPKFERPGGIMTSTRQTGVQWDAPYGWAPIQLIAVEGLRRYGFSTDADRVAQSFLDTVAENFRRDGNIREKYNVVTRSSETPVTAGYQTNVTGFGWTNGVFLELLHDLKKKGGRVPPK